MKSRSGAVETIDDYLRRCTPRVRRMLTQLRATIQQAAPQATEKISYRVPTFHWNGNLVHFAAFERHIGFYPAPSAIAEFQDELRAYKTSKGAVQFPLDQPLPLALVAKMVRFRLAENAAKKPRTSASMTLARRTRSPA